MDPRTLKHIKTQILASGISNALLNAFFTWVMNGKTAFIPGSSIAVDTFLTTGFVSCLVTFPTAHFTRKAIKAGLPLAEKETSFVNRLPRKSVPLWLILWLAFLVLFEVLLFLLLKAGSLDRLPLLPLAIAKFLAYGLMGGFLGGFIAFRQLQPERQLSQISLKWRKGRCSNT